MAQPFEITIHNRYSNKKMTEKVYGAAMVEFAYASVFGKLLAPLISHRSVSQFYGKRQDALKSAKKVPVFINEFDIDINEYEKGSYRDRPIEESYKTFNEFFIRAFKPGQREFVTAPEKMGAFAEARYFGYDTITPELMIPVKGDFLRAVDLIGKSELAQKFEGGPLLLARLCPVDYHRYHYPDSGETISSFEVPGEYHSVNPLALKHRGNIFIKNFRRVSLLKTENFGELAYIEVGATCVGKIVQSHDESKPFSKGDQKGYFLFGGSTVIVCGEPGKWKPSSDILANSEQGIETYIKLGDEVAELARS
ncbi:MAG: phosphatidylserine decarboxylase [Halobacteriovoraceae bacterium]|nr:phosphatidylserine decarboxylase [Halobacteriovoraceae bacterium]|tara:strand:+ start:881 stop:1807 length:927 start_codon:yes stop_codon:yes gene_type:complete